MPLLRNSNKPVGLDKAHGKADRPNRLRIVPIRWRALRCNRKAKITRNQALVIIMPKSKGIIY